MTDKPEGPDAPAESEATGRPLRPQGWPEHAFEGMSFYMVLERTLAAIEQSNPVLATAGVTALRDFVPWPDNDENSREQIFVLLDQVERLIRPQFEDEDL